MLFDGLDDYQADRITDDYSPMCGSPTQVSDDYQAGRCADCATHRRATSCHGCQWEGSVDQYAPPITGSADLSYLPRLESARVTAEWRTKSARRPSDLSETPLFGGRKQKELF